MSMRDARRRLDLSVGRQGIAIANVVFDRAEKQRRRLRDQGKSAPQIMRIKLFDRVTFQQDLALLRVVKTQQQVEQCRFARP